MTNQDSDGAYTKKQPGLEEAPERVSVPLASRKRGCCCPTRVKLELRACDLESLLPEGHRLLLF